MLDANSLTSADDAVTSPSSGACREVMMGQLEPLATGLQPLKRKKSGLSDKAFSSTSLSGNPFSGNDLGSRQWANNPAANVHLAPFNQPDFSLLDGPSQLQHMQRYVQQQQKLRQIERLLRSSLNLPTILGATVIETAPLFNARQVSILRYVPDSKSDSSGHSSLGDRPDNWQLVAQYCQNQSLAWQSAFTITQAEFPEIMQQLRQGECLTFFPGSSSPIPIQLPISSHQSDGATEKTTRSNLASGAVSHSQSPQGQERQSQAPPSQERQSQAPPSQAPPSQAPPSQVSQTLETETRQWLAHWPGSWLLVPIKQDHYQCAALNPWAARNAQLPSSASSPEEHWGVIALAMPETERWPAEAIANVQSITAELAIAIEQAQQYQSLVIANQELQKLALSDGLTALANRRRFDEHLADEWQRLARDQQPLSLILCDLDHFKRYNDTFGHPAGDRCLIRVARALLKGPQRPADLVARYGGEEFAIILPNTDTHGAWRIAQKIHDNIRELKIAHAPDNEEPYVTVTMGVSTVVPGHDTTALMLVQASDLALYHAKQQGRNRTYVHAYYNTVDAEDTDNKGNELQPAMTPYEEGDAQGKAS